MIEAGQFGDALDILRPLASDHPDSTNVRFLLGLAAIEAAARAETEEARNTLLDQAIATLQSILIDHPGLVRVRLELARAFFLKGEDDLSREHFERVLAGKPPLPIVANIRNFLDIIRARQRWSGYFGLAIAPDTNINAASDATTLYIGGLPFRFDEDEGARSGLGIHVWAGGEYQYPLSNRLRLRTGGAVARQEYASRDFDQTWLSAHTGPRWIASQNTEFSLLASARRRWTAGKPYNREIGILLETAHHPAQRLRLTGRGSWYRRHYHRRQHLDGHQAALALGGAWFASPTIRINAMIGYSREHTKALVWRNATRWLRLGVSVALPRGFTVGGGGEIRRAQYRGRWAPFTPDGSARRDRVRILDVSLFNRAFTISGFSPQLFLVNEVRTSNAQLYGYRRTRAEIRFVRQF